MTSVLDSLEQRYVDVDGAPARVLVLEADGPTLVLVQPGSAVPEVFLPLAAQLAGRARLVLPDLPGHGCTAYRRRPGLGPHAVLARHVGLVMDALGVERAVVGGSSLGAHVALAVALRQPGRVTGVVAIGSASAFADEVALAAVLARHNAASGAVTEDTTLAGARGSLTRFLFRPGASLAPEIVWAQHLSRTQPDVSSSNVLLFADLADPVLVRPDRVADRLEEVQQPVLIVWGRMDRFAGLKLAETAVPRLPAGRLVVLEESGHLPMLEQPGELARLVAEHLSRCLSPTSDAIAQGFSA